MTAPTSLTFMSTVQLRTSRRAVVGASGEGAPRTEPPFPLRARLAVTGGYARDPVSPSPASEVYLGDVEVEDSLFFFRWHCMCVCAVKKQSFSS